MLLPVTLLAAGRVKGDLGRYDPRDETVGLFAGIGDGRLDARLIAKSSKQCRVLVTNQSGKPLNVALPEVFAGVPVQAQLFPEGVQRDARSNQGPQPIGGSFPPADDFLNLPPGRGFPGNAPPAGNLQGNQPLFNLPPEGSAHFRLRTVCLEHGRPNPRPKFRYEIRPLADVAHGPAVAELCRLLADEKVAQKAVQAAAWHLNNGMSWEQLEALRIDALVGAGRSYFAPKEVAMARRLAADATDQAPPPEAHADLLGQR
jgi:hypothetical protein